MLGDVAGRRVINKARGLLDVEIHPTTTTQIIVWTLETERVMRPRHMLSQTDFAIVAAQNTEMRKVKNAIPITLWFDQLDCVNALASAT